MRAIKPRFFGFTVRDVAFCLRQTPADRSPRIAKYTRVIAPLPISPNGTTMTTRDTSGSVQTDRRQRVVAAADVTFHRGGLGWDLENHDVIEHQYPRSIRMDAGSTDHVLTFPVQSFALKLALIACLIRNCSTASSITKRDNVIRFTGRLPSIWRSAAQLGHSVRSAVRFAW